jgi:hypothetical protein
MHKKIAGEVIEFLHAENSRLSIALSGSVANNTYHKDSDIDLLVQDKMFRNSYYIYCYYKDIKIGIFSYRPNIFLKRSLDFLYHYHSMRLSYILSSKIIYDPDNIIAELKNNAKEIFIRRKLMNDFLIRDLKNEIMQYLENLPVNIIEQKEILYKVLSNILSIFFLNKSPNMVLNKREACNPYDVIKETDSKLYHILISCYPVNKDSRKQISEAFKSYISLNY